MREVIFKTTALAQYKEWQIHDKKISQKIITLIEDIINSPFKGIGKPEALKYSLKGFWSRRISKEHRLVYQVTTDAIIIVSCKFHY